MKVGRIFYGLCFLTFFVCGSQAQHKMLKLVPTDGQLLSQYGIDTTNADQLRAALQGGIYSDGVLGYLTDHPDPAFVPDILSFLGKHTEPWLMIAGGKALLEVGNPRGTAILDSMILVVRPRSPQDAERKIEAINAFAVKGVYRYVDTLIANYVFLVKSMRGITTTLFSAMQLYAARPEYQNMIVSTMIGSFGSSGEYDRHAILKKISETTTQQAYEFLFHLLKTSTSVDDKLTALGLLAGKPTPEFESYVYQAAETEPDAWLRRHFIGYLFSLQTPIALDRIQQLLRTETDTGIRETFDLLVSTFKPREPEATTPVLVLIDSLISYKHQCAALGSLADANFANELDNGLENAKKHLARADSANCAKEIEQFQKKVEKEYERTIGSDKKNQPQNKRRVTPEAYKFLYYNAQYIVDRLPKK